jgi:hypothetical protein
MVPFVCNLIPEGAKVAVLTYDGTRLTNKQCKAAGWTLESLPVVAAGVENTESWRQMGSPEPKVTHEMLAADVGGALDKLRAKHPEIRAVVFECAGFPSVTDHIRATSGLPVFDILSLSDLVMWSVAQVRAEARAAAE